MTFHDAVEQARRSGSGMIWQESKPWHHRGIRTEFSSDERSESDWHPVPLGVYVFPEAKEQANG